MSPNLSLGPFIMSSALFPTKIVTLFAEIDGTFLFTKIFAVVELKEYMSSPGYETITS